MTERLQQSMLWDVQRNTYCGPLHEVCWHRNNGAHNSHVVGEKKSNAWGLYDMHGNVWEWCSDLYGDYPVGYALDPIGAEDGLNRVARGGSWCYYPVSCRSAARSRYHPSGRHSCDGFRVVADE
ncbi:formylglycine-generating enzyme family protein [candidate division CSSED10-310 bacterium]|uniref:Formylglycine-generating enzyme family protein n=1 Tax=candidate division CSSED10-310 bacterium TaxID=2855610 RepID=A0ABV6YX10_UNCC1